jgi:predicted nucleic acid-binding Zn ribbon protein
MAAVAERLGVSYNAVKIRRQRAEQRLLEFLGVLPDPSGRSKGHSFVRADDESPQRLLRRLQLIAES